MSVPLLDPELLKAFVAVADSRSFTRAASQLNRTQSAVSMQIKRLEERLGVALFNRTKANVDLSSAGEGLLGYARRILTLNDEAVGKLRERKIEGVVRLGVMDDYGTLIVPQRRRFGRACLGHGPSFAPALGGAADTAGRASPSARASAVSSAAATTRQRCRRPAAVNLAPAPTSPHAPARALTSAQASARGSR